MENKELEEMYNKVAIGSKAPSAILFHCQVCKKSFFITKDQPDMCEHLRAELATRK